MNGKRAGQGAGPYKGFVGAAALSGPPAATPQAATPQAATPQAATPQAAIFIVIEVSLMSNIVLASGSPRRRELLERIGVTDFVVRVPEVEETFPQGLSPQEVVSYISREKAEAAVQLCGPEDIVITADLSLIHI